MAYITSDKYPHLKNNLLVGSLKFQYLEHDILEGIGRVRDIKQSLDGFICVAVEGLGIENNSTEIDN